MQSHQLRPVAEEAQQAMDEDTRLLQGMSRHYSGGHPSQLGITPITTPDMYYREQISDCR